MRMAKQPENFLNGNIPYAGELRACLAILGFYCRNPLRDSGITECPVLPFPALVIKVWLCGNVIAMRAVLPYWVLRVIHFSHKNKHHV